MEILLKYHSSKRMRIPHIGHNVVLSLVVPEQWEHKKSRLALTMLDTFNADDDLNILATMLFRKLRPPLHDPDDVICGTVYIANETVDDIIDFTIDDYIYIRDRVFK